MRASLVPLNAFSPLLRTLKIIHKTLIFVNWQEAYPKYNLPVFELCWSANCISSPDVTSPPNCRSSEGCPSSALNQQPIENESRKVDWKLLPVLT